MIGKPMRSIETFTSLSAALRKWHIIALGMTEARFLDIFLGLVLSLAVMFLSVLVLVMLFWV